ncbi:hypothetical protein FFF34_006205 [Inquilinus sp. KBS0705]|nr:hypothetical protein FFF34_006205 [Inquilinus sp. KBS0705]
MNFFKQINIYYIVTLLFLLLSSNANILASNDVIWFLILLFMCSVAAVKKLINLKDVRIFSTFALAYLILYFFRDIVINKLDLDFIVSDTLYLFKYILLSFVFCKILKEKLATYVVKVVVHLTIISFVFYALQLIGLGDYIFKYSSALGLKSKSDFEDYTNFIIFTFLRGSEFRNAGFVWEPGAFGCFLIITMILNFFLNNFTIDRKAKILIVAMLTTLSTTNYVSLLVLLFCRYRIKVVKLNVGAIFLVLISVILVIYIPVLGDKITNTYTKDMADLNRLNKLAPFYRHIRSQIPLNRFSSMAFIYDTFGFKLLLGVSNKYEVIANKIYDIDISNGIFDFAARFGFLGLIYVLYKYSKFCLNYIRNIEHLIYFLLIFLILGFGEPVLTLPLFLIFLFIDLKQLNLFNAKVRRVKFSDLDMPPIKTKLKIEN